MTMYSLHRLSAAVVTLLTLLSISAFLSLAWNTPARGTEPSNSLVLVARPNLNDPLYGKSILVARAMPGGQHVGFILNKPTELKLTEAFPAHEGSKSVTDPLYLGGPSDINAVFAMVRGQDAPDQGTLSMTQGVYLAISDTAVDKAMAPGDHARFFVGAVVWRPGELDAEIKQGAWYVMPATAELLLPRRTTGLWEELVRQAEITANSI